MSSLDARRHTIPDGEDTPSRGGIFTAAGGVYASASITVAWEVWA